MIIRTAYQSNAKGTGQIVAKGGGKQRTVNWDHAQTREWNHAQAAGTLALALGLDWHDGIEMDSSDDGTKAGWKF